MHVHPPLENEDMEFHAERALFAANSVGIQRVIVLSNSYSKMAYLDYARTQNSFVAKGAKKNPSKIAGACAINPSMDWAVEEMRRCKQDGLKILKIHTLASGMDLRQDKDLRDFKKILAHAQSLKFTVLVHGHFPKPARGQEAEIFLKAISDFPNTKFIIGHLLGKDFELLKGLKHPNFLVEVSALPILLKTEEEKKLLVKTIRKVGIGKFVFGSDWPIFHPAEMINAIKQLSLTSTERESLIYGNGKALDELFAP